MALGRGLLKGLGLSDEQIDTIIDAHTETVDGLKAEVAKYKSSADQLKEVQKKLDEAETSLETEKKNGWKAKYEALKDEYDNYKTEQSSKELKQAKENAYKDLLKDAGVSDKRVNTILRVSDLDDKEMGSDGKFIHADEILENIKQEWADFIQTTSAEGAKTPTPPSNTGGTTMTKDEIMKIKDPVARQTAIAENINLFRKDD